MWTIQGNRKREKHRRKPRSVLVVLHTRIFTLVFVVTFAKDSMMLLILLEIKIAIENV